MNESDNRDVSHIQSQEAEVDSNNSTNGTAAENDVQANKNNGEPDVTPGKILNVVSPIPEKIEKVKGRSSKVAEILTSQEFIESKKKRAATLMEKEKRKKAKTVLPKNIPNTSEKNNVAFEVKPGVSGMQGNKSKGTSRHRKKKKARRQSESDSSTDESFVISSASDSENEIEEENKCCCQGNIFYFIFLYLPINIIFCCVSGCGEEYALTKKKGRLAAVCSLQTMAA